MLARRKSCFELLATDPSVSPRLNFTYDTVVQLLSSSTVQMISISISNSLSKAAVASKTLMKLKNFPIQNLYSLSFHNTSVFTQKYYYSTQELTPDQVTRRKLKWRSMERGMKENEIILRSFIEHHLDKMPTELLEQYEELLDFPDPDLHKWMMGSKAPPVDVAESDIWKLLESHIKTHNWKAKSQL